MPMEGLSGSQLVRGAVTSTANGQITVKTDKGEAYRVVLTDNTKIMKDRQPLKLGMIRPGDNIGAMGVLDLPAKTVHAVFVMVVDAEQVKRAREGLGKVYIVGRVTAIDELKLTIMRPDNVSQVIEVDESTSFRKGGRQMASAISGVGPAGSWNVNGGVPEPAAPTESITLGDIRIGDSVMGKGVLKGGTFVPSQLAVADPSTRQHRR